MIAHFMDDWFLDLILMMVMIYHDVCNIDAIKLLNKCIDMSVINILFLRFISSIVQVEYKTKIKSFLDEASELNNIEHMKHKRKIYLQFTEKEL